MFSYPLQAEAIQSLQGSFLSLIHPVWMLLQYLDSAAFYLLIANLLVALLPRGQSQRYLYFLIFALYFNALLKYVCDQPRPGAYIPSLDRTGIGNHWGFPSGGAMGAVLIAGLVIRFLSSWWGWGLGLFYVFVISTSRIYLGAHFFTDVLGGWFFGSLSWVLFLVGERLWEQSQVIHGGAGSLERKAQLLTLVLAPLLYSVSPTKTVLHLVLLVSGVTLGYLLPGQGNLPKPRLWTALVSVLGTVLIFLGAKLPIPFAADGAYVLIGLWLSFGCSRILAFFLGRPGPAVP